MNSFTHSGLYQIIRRNTANEITPNYTDGELIDALDTANSFGILTAIAISNMAAMRRWQRRFLIVARSSSKNES